MLIILLCLLGKLEDKFCLQELTKPHFLPKSDSSCVQVKVLLEEEKYKLSDCLESVVAWQTMPFVLLGHRVGEETAFPFIPDSVQLKFLTDGEQWSNGFPYCSVFFRPTFLC